MTAPATILVVDDDVRLLSLLTDYLTKQGFYVCAAKDVAQAREKMRWITFDAMVLDRMMPGETGLTFAQSLHGSALPILMLTAMAESQDRIDGLEAGVEDYLSKPFEPRELVLRLRNLLQRQLSQQECRFGAYRYHSSPPRLFRGTEEIYLTANEQALMECLASKQGQPVSREAIALALGAAADLPSRTIDVQINRLRKKLEDDPSRPIYLQTVRGEGYILK